MEIFLTLLTIVMTAATPLLLAALGETVTERSGVLNLGVEGMMIMGAVGGFGGAYLSGNPWVGVNLDSGNFRTDDPYKDFAECVPYSVNVQFKVEIKGTATTARPADLKRFTKILRDGGYQGWVALEYEAKEDSAVAVPRYLREMRELFAAG